MQALFDDRVGEESLNPLSALYTNIADNPEPRPTQLLSDFVLGGTQAFMVVDNCPAELHSRLSETCRQKNSKVSLITVEYDIREDQPEGTEVFTLQTSSTDLIEKLLRQRFIEISQIDVRRIARFSEGNSRVAIALAETMERGSSVAGLGDDQLFQRLFHQRHEPDPSLYLVAQACSLVYSFHGEDIVEGDGSELARLGAIVGKTAQDVYHNVAELRRRDLIQGRGVWRAVLPQALADRLAARAFQTIPYILVEAKILRAPCGRLLKSFSRRLGYLHASTEAKKIADLWLGPGGILEDVLNFDNLHQEVLKNIAPAAPEQVLATLKRVCGQYPQAGEPYLDLVKSLAFESVHFERSATLMVEILIAYKPNEQTHGRQLFASLFQLYLSGTLATIKQRMAVLNKLINSPDTKCRALRFGRPERDVKSATLHGGW